MIQRAIVESDPDRHLSPRLIDGRAKMLIDQAHAHRIQWRKLGIALVLAACVALLTLMVRSAI